MCKKSFIREVTTVTTSKEIKRELLLKFFIDSKKDFIKVKVYEHKEDDYIYKGYLKVYNLKNLCNKEDNINDLNYDDCLFVAYDNNLVLLYTYIYYKNTTGNLLSDIEDYLISNKTYSMVLEYKLFEAVKYHINQFLYEDFLHGE